MTRNKAFFINGGAGRVVCSIPALEKFAEENPDNNFIIICEGSTEFYKGHPQLHAKAYDHWHKNLFEDKLKDMDLVSPEPYRVWEYYNQKASLAQAYDIAINDKGIRDLPRPQIKLSKQEQIVGQQVVSDVKEKTGKKKTIVMQPFGRGIVEDNGIITDFSGRSIEPDSMISLLKVLSKDYAIIFMGEISFEFSKHGITESIAVPQKIDLRAWSAIISKADHFLGCDSVGQHLAYAFNKTATIVIGSTFKENVSYPDDDKFTILDMGEGARVYSPIRITIDEYSDRVNEGIMSMNTAIEEVIIKEVNAALEDTVVDTAADTE
ncbi:MAG: glycosyltransferase family 9 protein [Methylophagaceae bacterium]|tara:strand:+ start:829 stop:1794 length:966 start_codon:yes stop_codon:yes gene_type:complete